MTPDVHPQPKPKTTRRQEQSRRRRELERIDRLENMKVHARSGGRCETPTRGRWHTLRCPRKATQVHHFLKGIGRRGRRGSELARNKIHACQECHDWLEAHPTNVRFDPKNAFMTLEVFR